MAGNPGAAARPLAGVRVLDFTRLLPGGYCTWLLANLGATVIKVEDSDKGDYMRDIGTQADGQGATYQLINRGKASLSVNLRSPGAAALLLEVIQRDIDVVIEGFRPGVMERIGLAARTVLSVKPSVVYASITGYGQTGPLASAPGHDLNFLAESGQLDRCRAAGIPRVQEIPWGDLVGGGLVPALAIAAMVYRGRTTGVGGTVDLAMAEALPLLPTEFVSRTLLGETVAEPGMDEFTGPAPYYGVYRLRDGFAVVAAVEEKFWRNLCAVTGLDEYADQQFDRRSWPSIRSALEHHLAPLSRDEAAAAFDGRDCLVSVVRTYQEYLESPQARERDLVRESDSRLPVLGSPFVVDGERLFETGGAPRRGASGRDVLRWYGLTDDTIDAMVADGLLVLPVTGAAV